MAQRFGFAWAGIVAAWRREVSFRIQICIALILPVVLLLLRPPTVWWALCVMAAMGVLAAELFNTAFAALIDHLHPAIHPAIKFAKDCAAGAVLIVSAGALVIGILTGLVALGVLS